MLYSLVGQRGKGFVTYILSIFLLNLPLFIPSAIAHEVVREEWVATYDNPSGGSDTITALALDSSGNLYVTGTSDNDYLTIKYDTQGNQLWVARYDSGDTDSATDFAVDSEGNVYVIGATTQGYDTVKYDSQGNQLWVARYEASNPEGPGFLAIDIRSNVYVTGTTGTRGTTNTVIIKYTPQGSEQWIAINEEMEGVSGMEVDSNANIYMTGYAKNSREETDYCTIKYDPGGKQLWKAKYDGGNNDYPTSLAIDAENYIYVTGASYPGYATIKYDSEGN
jgi:sugar lactone lactonase YvrE